jgi:hypothetical protein
MTDYGSAPLHAACSSGHVDVAFVLLVAGADLGSVDHGGDTPLDVATTTMCGPQIEQDMLPSRADAVEALRGIFEATGMIPHVAQCAVYHRYVCRPSMHDSLAEEFISSLRSGAYEDEDAGGSEEGWTIAQGVKRRRCRPRRHG